MREQIVGHHALDDCGDVVEQLVEIQRLRRDARHFQQEVEQLGALAKRTGALRVAWPCRGEFAALGESGAVASTILTLALAPMRVAPAAIMLCRSSSVRMPPDAFTPISRPTAGAHQRDVVHRGAARCRSRWRS